MEAKRKFLFYALLRHDRNSVLETACNSLCETPARLFGHHFSSYDSVGYGVMRDALLGLARTHRLLSDRDIAAYCDEADILQENGNTGDALKFLGRGLEAAAISFALRLFVKKHNIVLPNSTPVKSETLKQLLKANPDILLEVEKSMSQYLTLYEQHVENSRRVFKNLCSILKANPILYMILSQHMQKATRDFGNTESDVVQAYKQVWLKRNRNRRFASAKSL